MKKTITLLMTIALTLALCCGAFAESYSVGVCQLMVHDSLDQATQGFVDALTEKMEEAGGGGGRAAAGVRGGVHELALH